MYKQILNAGLLIGVLGSPGPAQAASCANRDMVVDRLQTQYSEQLTAGGMQTAQSIMEVWTSEDTGTFTVILTSPNGQSCVVATGTHWFTKDAIIEPAGTAS